MYVAAAHECQQFKTIDVRHIDVGYHQVPATPRQDSQCVKATRRFEDFELPGRRDQRLEHRPNETSHAMRILCDENTRHELPFTFVRYRSGADGT